MAKSKQDQWRNASGNQAARLNQLLMESGHHTIEDLYQRLVLEFSTTTHGRVRSHITYLRKLKAKLSEYKKGRLLYIRLDK